MNDLAAAAAPGVLAAVAAGAALVGLARFVYLDDAAGAAFFVAAVAAAASIVALALFRRRARGRSDGQRRTTPVSVSASWLIAAAAAFGALLWVPGPADRFGSVVQVGVALLIAATCGIGLARAPGVRWGVALVTLTAGVLVLGFSNVVTHTRWIHARGEFNAIAAAPSATGRTEQRTVGTFVAQVRTRPDGSVTFRFGDSWQGLIHVPRGIQDPSPDDPHGYYQPWADRWWTYQAY